ncbi:hypothetical protein [Flavobacterium agrisoli]|uniref:PAP2 superfamily protein n=1 Tax=Flavobacterium agrisoli TaxID=2793066 RepID=A0A934UJD5_9FLAO|nr:hypothetical protein [Flavobacterium agrisoli]MBK0369300.1 hypothetical protein [Flavobacterium agrisoli]
MKKLLPIFSYIFHPIFISIYATLFYFFLKQDVFAAQEKLYILLQVFLLTVVIPILFFLLLQTTGKVESVMIKETTQRKIPLALQCLLFILLVKRTILVTRYPELHFFLLGALFSTLGVAILVFFKIKASLHMLGISALTLFLIGLSLHLQIKMPYLIAFFILMNGVVASSRLVMKAHSPFELSLGCAFGIFPQLLFLYLWL